MNAHDRAMNYFCSELDGYLEALIESGMTYDDAVDEALFEYDEFWRACLEHEQAKDEAEYIIDYTDMRREVNKP